MLIDARQQFEKEPKSFGNKRNRMTDAHRHWIEERYQQGWKPGFADDHVKIFRTRGFRLTIRSRWSSGRPTSTTSPP